MILLVSLLAGLAVGIARAWHGKRKLEIPELRLLWLVPIAFLPQLVAFHWRTTRLVFPISAIPYLLVASQILLLIFAWWNRKTPGFPVLLLGVALNLIVISLNGGWMPITPETVAFLAPNAPPTIGQAGQRLGYSKDWIIERSDTSLWLLSDRFTLPAGLPYQVAFSLGDVLIAGGVFWFCWSLGGPSRNNAKTNLPAAGN